MMRRFIATQEILKTFGMIFNSTEKGVFDKPDIYSFHIVSFMAEIQNIWKHHRFSSRSQVTWNK